MSRGIPYEEQNMATKIPGKEERGMRERGRGTGGQREIHRKTCNQTVHVTFQVPFTDLI